MNIYYICITYMSHNDHEKWAKKREITSLFLFNKSKNIAFVYIPKSGCSSVREYLIKNGGCEEIKQENLPKKCIKAALIRDPYDRLVSGFMTRDWLLNGKIYNKNYDGFKNFVDDLIKINPNNVNVHFTPQFILMNYKKDYFIFNIIDDIKKKSNKFIIFEKKNKLKNFPHEHNRKNSVSENIFNELKKDEVILSKINNYYEIDFLQFNFQKISL
jgi:Sulfotransferase family